jgi:hypothetical protein
LERLVSKTGRLSVLFPPIGHRGFQSLHQIPPLTYGFVITGITFGATLFEGRQHLI